MRALFLFFAIAVLAFGANGCGWIQGSSGLTKEDLENALNTQAENQREVRKTELDKLNKGFQTHIDNTNTKINTISTNIENINKNITSVETNVVARIETQGKEIKTLQDEREQTNKKIESLENQIKQMKGEGPPQRNGPPDDKPPPSSSPGSMADDFEFLQEESKRLDDEQEKKRRLRESLNRIDVYLNKIRSYVSPPPLVRTLSSREKRVILDEEKERVLKEKGIFDFLVNTARWNIGSPDKPPPRFITFYRFGPEQSGTGREEYWFLVP